MRPSRLLALVATVAVSGLLGGPAASPATASPWAPASSASITPGVQMVTRGAQCTGNFVFRDSRSRVYVGYAAHCAGKGEATDTDGCRTSSYPLGTWVSFVRGAGLLTSGTTVGRGRLAYSSWTTMQRRRTKNPNLCAFNDFALVRVGRAHVGKVNPSVPFWGGPTALATEAPALGSEIFSYGSSSLRQGQNALSPKTGAVTGTDGRGWGHYVYTATPGIPGDSGSGLLDARGRAFATLSTLGIAPTPGENGVGDLARELRYAQRHSGIKGLRLVKGTEPFVG